MKKHVIQRVMLSVIFAVVFTTGYAGDGYPRPIYPDTAIVQDGQPLTLVVYPSGSDDYRKMAGKIVAAVKDKTGAELKMLPDTEVTDAKHPVLLDAYRNRNLILLGRLGNNRAIWGVYNRFLCAVDGYYPGGDGYVVRTASNVYKNGANTIIAGGSSDKGAALAVDKLVEIIDKQQPKDGNLTLPWLLSVELGGECKTVFDDDERRQMARAFPGTVPHEDMPIKRFYENIMSYYWSGRESYLKLGLKFLDYNLEKYKTMDPKTKGFNSHYAAEFFVRAYDMIDDSGLLSADQIKTVDQSIIDTFYIIHGYDKRESTYRDWLKKPNGKADELRPIDDIYTADHQNSMWLADKVYADFILNTIPETAENAHIYKEARMRQSLYVKAFDALISERWRGCSTSSASTSGPTMTFFRYSLEMERYDRFFDSGNARKAALYQLARVAPSGLDIALLNPSFYDRTEFGLFVGIAASYYRDGELKSVLDTNPGIPTGFYGLFVNGVHTYRPGAEVKPVEPKSLTGAEYVPLEPVHFRIMKSSLPYEKTFDYVTFRNGFGWDADYLLLSGGHDLQANAILKLSSAGNTCLSNASENNTFDQNAVYVSCVSKPGSTENKPVCTLARLDHIANASSASYISSTLPGYAGTDWNRQIIYLPSKFFVVIDNVSALEPGKYLVMANWRPSFYAVENRFDGLGPATAGHLEGDRWIVKGEKTEFIMAYAGEKMQLIEDAQVNAVNRLSIPVYRQRIVSDLKKGESVTIANLMFTQTVGAKQDYEMKQTDEGGFIVRATDKQESFYYVGPLPKSLGKSDAPMVVISAERLTAFDAGTLMLQGKVLANNASPKTLESDMTDLSLQKALKDLWDSSKIAEPAATDQGNKTSTKSVLVKDWRYTGAQQPGLISGAKPIGNNTWDLGYVAELSKISVKLTSELSWEDRSKGVRCSDSGKVHSQILISADGQADSFKPFKGEVSDIPIPSMGAYGKIIKKENAYQTIRGIPQKARYVKVISEQQLPANYYLFYDAGRPDENGDPLKARVVNMRDKDKPDILVYPNIWPGRRDVGRLSHNIFALDSDGREIWSHEIKWRVFFVRALDWDGTGLKSIFVSSLDNNVYVYDGNGKLTKSLTLEGVEGIGDGMYPAKGYPLCASIGLWQPDLQGRSKLILPRYCHFNFLKSDGTLEGYVGCDDYYISDVLENGSDYNGDGIEDSVAMSPVRLYLLTGNKTGETATRVKLPTLGENSSSIASPTLAFHLFEKGSNVLFIARQNMIALFDLQNQKWLMSWMPETPIMAAVALPEHRQILCYTGEGILCRIKLGADFAVTGIDTMPVSTQFNRFAVLDKKQGTVVAASKDGLFRISMDNSVEQIVPGSFVDADVYPSDSAAEKIIAVDKTGAVESYRIR